MATATETRDDTAPDIKELVRQLGDSTVPVADLKKVNAITLSQAWIQGFIEFGRRTHIITGKPGPMCQTMGSVLVIEDSIDWTGYKRKSHKTTRELLAEDEGPLVDNQGVRFLEFQKYAPLTGLDPATQKPYPAGSFHRIAITETEAKQMIRLQVRICEKGFENLRLSAAA